MLIGEHNADFVHGYVVMKRYGRADSGCGSYGNTSEMAYSFLMKSVSRSSCSQSNRSPTSWIAIFDQAVKTCPGHRVKEGSGQTGAAL